MIGNLALIPNDMNPRERNPLNPQSIWKLPKKAKIKSRMENLDLLKNPSQDPDYKEERHKGCDLPLISSKVQLRTRGVKLNSQWINSSNFINFINSWKWGYKEYLNQNLIKTLDKIKPHLPKIPLSEQCHGYSTALQ